MFEINTTILSYMALVAIMSAAILRVLQLKTKKAALKNVTSDNRVTLRRQNLR